MERNFEIIGEAMRRLEKDDPDTAARITDCRRIIAFRNVLIHGYDVSLSLKNPYKSMACVLKC